MSGRLLAGAVAGATGTTALNAVTYLDMAIRGRPASDAPERTVEALLDTARLAVPGTQDRRGSRLSGLGGLSGIAVGVTTGVGFGAARRFGLRPRPVVGAVLIGLTAMMTTDVSMARLRVSDPRTWRAADWLADLVPHLVYGAATAAMLEVLDRAG